MGSMVIEDNAVCGIFVTNHDCMWERLMQGVLLEQGYIVQINSI